MDGSCMKLFPPEFGWAIEKFFSANGWAMKQIWRIFQNENRIKILKRLFIY